MSELIKLRVKRESATGEKAQNIINKFIEACIALDASIFEPMIEENKYFEEKNKYRFLASLKEQYDWAIARGAKDIITKTGKCEMCVRGCSVYEFFNSSDKLEFAYRINIKGDVVNDIFLCNMSSGRCLV
ncbi:hypothetical protein A5M85_05890 [Cellulophaga lytica]|uniref:hypothetical protein n=1 Tax=Cellulophaga lytica TaxID=979 RepID=UPI0009505065|nr:hypothetical protein [Cellulophaga lytica]APU09826.1 hypothetical protein A5M85_05890 [Cellulophaga lytica]